MPETALFIFDTNPTTLANQTDFSPRAVQAAWKLWKIIYPCGTPVLPTPHGQDRKIDFTFRLMGRICLEGDVCVCVLQIFTSPQHNRDMLLNSWRHTQSPH